MKKINLIISIYLFALPAFSQTKSIKIGLQTWTCNNLLLTKFRNGEQIQEAKTDAEWHEAARKKTPAFCYVESDTIIGKKTEILYNWWAVNDPRGLAPKGWHIPSKTEWGKLIKFLGDSLVAGKKLKSKTGWDSSPNIKNGNGDNSSGFNAYPVRWRHNQGKIFEHLGNTAYFWSTTEDEPEFKYENQAWIFTLFSFNNQAFFPLVDKGYGLAVRCIKD